MNPSSFFFGFMCGMVSAILLYIILVSRHEWKKRRKPVPLVLLENPPPIKGENGHVASLYQG